MKILVTGASGFVGGNLAERRLTHGDDVVVITRSGTDEALLPQGVRIFQHDGNHEQLSEFILKECFDGIVNCATHFCGTHTANDIDKLVDSNIRFGMHLFEAATKHDVPWMINTSTYTQHYENRDYSPANLYSATKQAFEDIVQYYAETTATTIATVTLFDTIGEGDRRNKIFRALLNAAKTGTCLELSPGEQLLDISPIQNVLDGYDRMVTLLTQSNHTMFNGKVFTLPSNERMTLRSFVALFESVLGRKLPVTFGTRPYREREMMLPWSHGEPVPGWKPHISLAESIQDIMKHELG